ncbi:unnamed protein product [Allacma fusca]|uniref:Uncharacterized protein n=1 Tax=Allacma fusca TaxID=39272 RepID=A0A8J2PTU9_9HEXA|nr:unnamed protein product [Allacma fusca]
MIPEGQLVQGPSTCMIRKYMRFSWNWNTVESTYQARDSHHPRGKIYLLEKNILEMEGTAWASVRGEGEHKDQEEWRLAFGLFANSANALTKVKRTFWNFQFSTSRHFFTPDLLFYIPSIY